MNPLLDQLADYPMVELARRRRDVAARGVRLFDFSVGDPHDPTPEFIREALCRSVPPRCGYPTVRGERALREAIAGYVDRRFGVQLDPATQILPTSGAKEAVFHTPLLVIDRDAEDRAVVFPDPGYPAYQRGALFAGGEAIAVPLDGDFVFRPWELPESVLRRTRMMWLNTPHNPSGAVTRLPDLERAADLCRRYDILLVSDEAYADLYHDTPPPSLLQVGVEGVLVLHSLSKRSGMTGYRSGFLAGDPDLIARLARLRSNPGLAPQSFVNAAATAAWSDDAHVAERRRIFREKRALLRRFFDEVGIEVHGSEGAIYMWIHAPEGHDDESYAALLLEAGIVVSPGRIFGVAGGGRGYLRLALVPELDEIAEAIEVWRCQV
ncbi:MAG: succinyldiaminopimelate transaminase [Deltaproteobacteria bacterium]|nr:MAG: succinyldiaminopimelate transaminase [Deltaproteobacteria bacterium]